MAESVAVHLVEQRCKQISMTKRSIGYERYRSIFPQNCNHEKIHNDSWCPTTPDVYKKASRSQWNQNITCWRKRIHKWANISDQDFELIKKDPKHFLNNPFKFNQNSSSYEKCKDFNAKNNVTDSSFTQIDNPMLSSTDLSSSIFFSDAKNGNYIFQALGNFPTLFIPNHYRGDIKDHGILQLRETDLFESFVKARNSFEKCPDLSSHLNLLEVYGKKVCGMAPLENKKERLQRMAKEQVVQIQAHLKSHQPMLDVFRQNISYPDLCGTVYELSTPPNKKLKSVSDSVSSESSIGSMKQSLEFICKNDQNITRSQIKLNYASYKNIDFRLFPMQCATSCKRKRF